ncbi:MAG: pantetheine-phosphate adenylyltransferase [Negativicoccus succinicivorans]|uniref:pantetheine-phosphate adenylyltransferase n=1 Tax=Negativicoccus succinicivorans TaxID=620903 RepID=UPI0026EE06B5|nr:pantetheine-phosphate adenylyltransferase [Negativicoccus succinicivorans]MBS6028421.1 pantetheine-phosphate adenylyltransferase [Negativicoccus succinicivorans]
MRVGICPGSFDPVTKGHVDIFERSAQFVDKLIVAVFVNPGKKPMFSMEERVALLKEATAHIPNVELDAFSGLLNDYVRQRDSRLIIRGLRAFSDFEYEFQRALLLKDQDPEIETVFMMTRGEYSFISSSGIKELAMFSGDVGRLVPPCVLTALEEKLAVAK